MANVDEIELDDVLGPSTEGIYEMPSKKVWWAKRICMVLLVVVVVLVCLLLLGSGIVIGFFFTTPESDRPCENNVLPEFNPNGLHYAPEMQDDSKIKYYNDVYTPLPSSKTDYVHRSRKDYQIDRNDPFQTELQETTEYQIRLDPSKFENDREAAVQEIIDLVNAYFVDDPLHYDDPEDSIWYELQYHIHCCGTKVSELRVRNYQSGPSVNTSSVSTNLNYYKSSKLPPIVYLPGVMFNDTEQKLEQDVHVCSHKYNRKVKVKSLQPDLVIESCWQLNELFPRTFNLYDAFDDSPKISSNKTLWNRGIGGKMFQKTSKFKMSFNLYYSSLSNLEKNRGISTGSEFSIRLYSLNKGYGPWDGAILDEMGHFYSYLIENYGSKENTDCS